MISQYDFESAMARAIEYGDHTKLAQAVGKSPSYYSQMLNPDDPRESLFYRAARDMVELFEIDTERGRKALAVFTSFVGQGIAKTTPMSVKREVADLMTKTVAAGVAVITEQSVAEQLNSIIDVEIQATKTKAAALEEQNQGRTREMMNGEKRMREVK